MAEKRFYWIKLKENFMTSDTVDFLMGQKNGANYVVLYQMLCLKTANTNGALVRQIGEVIMPYDIAKIQRDCKYFEYETVVLAMELYKRLGLIYEEQDGHLQISGFDELIGSETAAAGKMRELRAKRGNGKSVTMLPQCDNKVITSTNKEKVGQKETKQEIDIEKDIEIEKELDKEIDTDCLTDCQDSAYARAREEVKYWKEFLLEKINEDQELRFEHNDTFNRFINVIEDVAQRNSCLINGIEVASQDILRTFVFYLRDKDNLLMLWDIFGRIGYKVLQGEVHNQQYYTISTLYTVARNNGN